MLRTLVIAMALVACGSGSSQRDASSSSDAPVGDAPVGDARGDGAVTVDAAIAPGAACGATTCRLGQEECCIGTMTTCEASGTCPTQGFACDGPEDCPNAVCCFPNTGGSRCQTNNCQAIACHADTDCPGGTSKCCPKTISPNYKVCQVQC